MSHTNHKKFISTQLYERCVKRTFWSCQDSPHRSEVFLCKGTFKDHCSNDVFTIFCHLLFNSEVTEVVHGDQWKLYISTNNLDSELQSAHKAKQSTDEALLKVVSDIRLAVDQNQAGMLRLTDLSAAFYTVDYDLAVVRLANTLGICGVVLQWLNPYLRSCTQTLTITGALSVLAENLYGLPQGSVLGPLCYLCCKCTH